MSRSNASLLLLSGLAWWIVCLASSSRQLKYASFGEETSRKLSKPFVTSLDSRKALFVSVNDKSVNLELAEPSKVCNVTTDIPIARKTLEAKTLQNDKLVIYEHEDYAKKYLVVDFRNCKTDALIDSGYGQLDDPVETTVGSLVAYKDTFDVFDWYQRHCTPCRYNYKGERLQVAEKLASEPTGRSLEFLYQHNGFELATFKKQDASEGYFYSFKFANATSAIKILSPSFEVLKQRLVNRTVSSYSIDYATIFICYKSDVVDKFKIRQPIVCEKLDRELNSKLKVSMFTVDSADFTSSMYVQNLPDGSAMVLMSFTTGRSRDIEIYVQRIGPDGKTEKEIKFGSVSAREIKLHSLVVNQNHYCAFVYFKTQSLQDGFISKCIAPEEGNAREQHHDSKKEHANRDDDDSQED